MTDDEARNNLRNILLETAGRGLMGLATEALLKLDRKIAEDIMNKVESGKAGLSFGFMIRGNQTEVVAQVVEGTDAMHLVTVRRTEPAAPTVN